MTDYYVIGDVHGKAGMLEDLLSSKAQQYLGLALANHKLVYAQRQWFSQYDFRIRQMPFVVETDKYIFVHAGIDLTLDDWHETTDYKKV